MIKVYGERNTGTNYLCELIELNLEAQLLRGVVPGWINSLQRKVLPGKEWLRDLYFSASYGNNYGWKHACASLDALLKSDMPISKGVKFVTLTKNPYSWLLSLYRRPYHNRQVLQRGLDFESFLRENWPLLGRDKVAGEVNPVQLWNAKNRSYMMLAKESALCATSLRYEDLLASPEQVIQQIERITGCHRKTPRFADYTSSTKDAEKDSNYYRDYYLSEKWRAKLSPEAVAIINQYLDPEVMAHFSYAIIAPDQIAL